MTPLKNNMLGVIEICGQSGMRGGGDYPPHLIDLEHFVYLPLPVYILWRPFSKLWKGGMNILKSLHFYC